VGEIVAQGPKASGEHVGQKVVIQPGVSSGGSPEDSAGKDHQPPDYAISGEHFDGVSSED
jgi:threonine dehydrogenase-like Zn-dependent dehydrogenase